MISISLTEIDGVLQPATFPQGAVYSWCDGEYTHFYFEGEPIAPEHQLAGGEAIEPLPPPPDWRGFRLAMLRDVAYGAIALTHTAQIARIENVALAPVPELPVLKILWNQLIDLAGDQTPVVREQWQAIASANHIPITFAATGRIA